MLGFPKNMPWFFSLDIYIFFHVLTINVEIARADMHGRLLEYFCLIILFLLFFFQALVRIGVKYHQVWKRKRHVLFKSFFNAGLQIYFQGSCQKGTPLFPPDHYKCLINLSIHVADLAWFFTRDPSLIWNTVMDLTGVSFDFIWKAIWVFLQIDKQMSWLVTKE